MTEVKKTEEDFLKENGVDPKFLHTIHMPDGRHLSMKERVVKAMHENSQQVNAELLEALEKAMKYVEKYEDPTGWLVHILEADKKEMRAAIKRARGL